MEVPEIVKLEVPVDDADWLRVCVVEGVDDADVPGVKAWLPL